MSEMNLPPQIGGRYRPVRVIGKGGMGVVYEVEHLHTGQRFALKVLTAQPGASVERFKREARATSRIRSHHIVQVIDADVAPELKGAPFLVMELLEGSDLDALTRKGPSSREDVLEWLQQVARALAKAHDAGIVHRDLKPENIFLTRREDGSPLVKILDFGIAKIVAEVPSLTQSGGILGTPAYMAPEQTDSHGPPVTPRADLYALGLIAFRLLTGRMYWRDGSLAQLLVQILADPMPPASERGSTLGAPFDAWFRRACDRDPDKRFASPVEQIRALAVALGLPELPHVPAPDSVPASSAVPNSTPSLHASPRNSGVARKGSALRVWLAAGAAVVVAGLAMRVGLSIHSGAGEPSPPARPQSVSSAPSASTPPPAEGVSLTPPPTAGAAAVAPDPAMSDAAAPSSSSAASPGSARSSTWSAPAQRKMEIGAVIHPSADASRARDPLEEPY